MVKEGDNYVECACSHLSIYAAHAEFASLASYNEAFYASGFICISGIKHFPSVSPSSHFSRLKGNCLTTIKPFLSALTVKIYTCIDFMHLTFVHFHFCRLRSGYRVSRALFPVPHVCCQTAHSHDAELPGNSGNFN